MNDADPGLLWRLSGSRTIEDLAEFIKENGKYKVDAYEGKNETGDDTEAPLAEGMGEAAKAATEAAKSTVKSAATSSVHDMSTSIWTCWTSLVILVMSDGAPKRDTSWVEKPVTRWKRSLRTSRPKPMAALEPK